MKNIPTSYDVETKEVDSDNDNNENIIELKDPDLNDQKDISTHYNGLRLIQTDRSSAGLNLKNCVLLDSGSTIHDFCNSNLLEDI